MPVILFPGTLTNSKVSTPAGITDLDEAKGALGLLSQARSNQFKERAGEEETEAALLGNMRRIRDLIPKIAQMDLEPKPRNFVEKLRWHMRGAMDPGFKQRLADKGTRAKLALMIQANNALVDTATQIRQLGGDPFEDELLKETGGEIAKNIGKMVERERLDLERNQTIAALRAKGYPISEQDVADIYRSDLGLPTTQALIQHRVSLLGSLQNIAPDLEEGDIEALGLSKYQSFIEAAKTRRAKETEAKKKSKEEVDPLSISREFRQLTKDYLKASEEPMQVPSSSTYTDEMGNEKTRQTVSTRFVPSIAIEEAESRARKALLKRFADSPRLQEVLGILGDQEPLPAGPSQDETLRKTIDFFEEQLRGPAQPTE